MKFSCDRCHRRFSTREDPVPGRVYRIGCRCGNVIVLRPTESGASPSSPSRPPAAPPFAPTLRRAVPPPLPPTKIHSVTAREESPPADAGPVASAGAPAANAPRPALPVLATTPTPVPVYDDACTTVPVGWRGLSPLAKRVHAARASLAARLAAWRSSSPQLRAVNVARPPPRTSWPTLLASCAASAGVAAFLTGWLMTAAAPSPADPPAPPQPRNLAVAAITLPTPPVDPGPRVAARAAARRPPAAALPGPGPRADPMPAAYDAPSRAIGRDVAPPARAEISEASLPRPDGLAPADGSAADDRRAARETATPDLTAAASDGAGPERADAAATASAIPEEAERAQEDDAAPVPVPVATQGPEPVPATALLPEGGSSGDSAAATEPL